MTTKNDVDTVWVWEIMDNLTPAQSELFYANIKKQSQLPENSPLLTVGPERTTFRLTNNIVEKALAEASA